MARFAPFQPSIHASSIHACVQSERPLPAGRSLREFRARARPHTPIPAGGMAVRWSLGPQQTEVEERIRTASLCITALGVVFGLLYFLRPALVPGCRVL